MEVSQSNQWHTLIGQIKSALTSLWYSRFYISRNICVTISEVYFESDHVMNHLSLFLSVGISHSHYILCRGDHKQETAFFNQEMGCGWGCRPKTLGNKSRFIVFIMHNNYESWLWSAKHVFLFSQGKFQAFYQYAKSFNSDDFDYEELKNSDYVFMRWKVRCTLWLKPHTLPFKMSGSVRLCFGFERN